MMQRLRNYDFTLIIMPIFLAAFGLVMIYSASMVTAVFDNFDGAFYFKRQLFWFVISLIGFIALTVFPYRNYQRLIKLIILISFIMLIGVLLYGDTVNNATRSINLFGLINLQPAEFVKLGIIIYLASIYSKKQQYIGDLLTGVSPPLILTIFFLFLIILQPDIGTAAIIALIAIMIVISSGIRLKHLALIGASSLILLIIVIPKMVTETRIARITGAYNPFAAPETDGYHLIQSYLAIGVGGLKGEGLGQSVQKLGFLWGAHTDFIMSVIAEELGVFGVIIVIGGLALIVLRGFFIARKCDDNFGALLAIGISSMIGIQTLFNLGAISGILPITGVPLPFISYGGSSLLVLMLSMGILNNIAKQIKDKDNEPMVVNQEQGRNIKSQPTIRRQRVWTTTGKR